MRRLLWGSDHQEGEEVSSLSDDGVGLAPAKISESQDSINPGGAGKRKALHLEDR